MGYNISNVKFLYQIKKHNLKGSYTWGKEPHEGADLRMLLLYCYQIKIRNILFCMEVNKKYSTLL